MSVHPPNISTEMRLRFKAAQMHEPIFKRGDTVWHEKRKIRGFIMSDADWTSSVFERARRGPSQGSRWNFQTNELCTCRNVLIEITIF